MKFIVTGCGRSGTGYIATRLRQSGVKCGHEQVFSVVGPCEDSKEYEGDSSWFAAPFLGSHYSEARILHVVRDPRSVIDSFHRIGLCASSRYRHFTMSKGIVRFSLEAHLNPKQIKSRWDYVAAHRKLLRTYTTCAEKETEFARLCEYWVQWNFLIEENVVKYQLPYMRLRLEDIEDHWPKVKEFLGVSNDVRGGEPTNRKTGYKPIKKLHGKLPENLVALARRYGYQY